MVVCKCKNLTEYWSHDASKAVCTECVVEREHSYVWFFLTLLVYLQSYVGLYHEFLDFPHPEKICPLTKMNLANEINVIRLMDFRMLILIAISCSHQNSTISRLWTIHNIRINWYLLILHRSWFLDSCPSCSKWQLRIGEVYSFSIGTHRMVERLIAAKFCSYDSLIFSMFLLICRWACARWWCSDCI